MKKSRTVARPTAVESARHLPLVDLLVDARTELGGRKVAVRRPRVRADGREVSLPTFQAMADVDPLNRRVVEQMLVGVATRRYARSLEPVPATMRRRGTSKSAVSRRFVAKRSAQLAA